MTIEELLIPKERIAILIGPKGEVKKRLESKTSTKIHIDSKTGEISIEGDDALQVMVSAKVSKAIGRGFSPEKAFKLLEDGYYFEVINLQDVVGKNYKTIQTKKGRIIGKEGKIRNKIEEETNTTISVYGKTVGIIGKGEDMEKAMRAITMLLEGASHNTVLNYLRQSLSVGETFEFR
jgi:ribosomal RNA assembly protein